MTFVKTENKKNVLFFRVNVLLRSNLAIVCEEISCFWNNLNIMWHI